MSVSVKLEFHDPAVKLPNEGEDVIALLIGGGTVFLTFEDGKFIMEGLDDASTEMRGVCWWAYYHVPIAEAFK